MKRIVIPALVALCLLFSLPDGRSRAQQPDQKNAGLNWQPLRDGVKVLKLWESVGPTWPEIAVLRLSKDEYKEFVRDSVNYLNSLKVYPPEYPAQKVIPCRVVPLTKAENEYVVVINHDPNSTSTTIPSGNVVF